MTDDLADLSLEERRMIVAGRLRNFSSRLYERQLDMEGTADAPGLEADERAQMLAVMERDMLQLSHSVRLQRALLEELDARIAAKAKRPVHNGRVTKPAEPTAAAPARPGRRRP